MIDALLHAVRDFIRGSGLGYPNATTCDIRDNGQPPPGNASDWFVSVHQGGSRNDMMNALNEYYNFSVTLTARLTNVDPDHIGDQLLARKLTRDLGFNRRAGKLKIALHMEWELLQIANNYMVEWTEGGTVYGFTEPAHFANTEIAQIVGPEWLWGSPEGEGFEGCALKAEISFEGARRLQALQSFT
jgi:hypothetical protein